MWKSKLLHLPLTGVDEIYASNVYLIDFFIYNAIGYQFLHIRDICLLAGNDYVIPFSNQIVSEFMTKSITEESSMTKLITNVNERVTQ